MNEFLGIILAIIIGYYLIKFQLKLFLLLVKIGVFIALVKIIFDFIF